MFYPLFLNPIYKKTLWGGRNLERLYGRKLPEGKIGESWEAACHNDDISSISNGEFKGTTLLEIMNIYKEDFIGTNYIECDKFPLLVKFIDANDKLSVQVHPDNCYAEKYENDMGKNEMWYVVATKPGAKLVYGLRKGTSKKDFERAISNKCTAKYLNYIDIYPGDALYIPSGTVHAILDGVLIAEIQQNSDTTYRLYDWDRIDSNGMPRELHIKKALDVINYNFKGNKIEKTLTPYNGYKHYSLLRCEFFTVELIKVLDDYTDYTDGSTLYIYTCIEGSGRISAGNNNYPIKPGNSFIVPAKMGQFRISGKLKLLKAFI